MDSIAGTGLEGEKVASTPAPSLLVIVLDTNPFAWEELLPQLTLNGAISDLLVFINAHLACNHANRIAVLASHCRSSVWLYPSSPNGAIDEENFLNFRRPTSNPNKYRPFSLVEHELLENFRHMISKTTEEDLQAGLGGTMLAGSLTLAISYISKVSLLNASINHTASASPDIIDQTTEFNSQNARLLIVSTSGNLAIQYIPLMNLIFAAQHLRIPLDIVKLAGDSVLLEQASYTTSGVFISPIRHDGRESGAFNVSTSDTDSANQISLLPTLLFAFLPDPITRRYLLAPTAISVDFRAACFCHRRVIDIGYVCSICLSIFCEEGVVAYMKTINRELPPGSGECLTCGSVLDMKLAGNIDSGNRPSKKRIKKQRNHLETTAEAAVNT